MTAHLKTFWHCTRTSATFCDIQLQYWTVRLFPVLQALRRRMFSPGRRTSGLNIRSLVQGTVVAERQCGGYLHSYQSVPNRTAQVLFSISHFLVTMTSGYRQWNGPKHVATIQSGDTDYICSNVVVICAKFAIINVYSEEIILHRGVRSARVTVVKHCPVSIILLYQRPGSLHSRAKCRSWIACRLSVNACCIVYDFKVQITEVL